MREREVCVCVCVREGEEGCGWIHWTLRVLCLCNVYLQAFVIQYEEEGVREKVKRIGWYR